MSLDVLAKYRITCKGIAPLKKDSGHSQNKIYVSRWLNLSDSFQIDIRQSEVNFENQRIILDSGVIEELALEIKKLKEEKRTSK